MVTTEHKIHTKSGLSIYVKHLNNGKVLLTIQGNKKDWVCSEASDSFIQIGEIKVSELIELEELFNIAFDCAN